VAASQQVGVAFSSRTHLQAAPEWVIETLQRALSKRLGVDLPPLLAGGPFTTARFQVGNDALR